MASQRNTRQRRVVLEELRKLTSHPTAANLYDLVRQRLPKISLGTVYRNLEVLTRLGLAQKVETGGAEARFDGNPDEHYHIRCIKCGRVGDLHGLPRDLVRVDVKESDGYEIMGCRVEFLGVCPHCRARPDQEEESSP